MAKTQFPMERRDFLKGILGGAIALPLGNFAVNAWQDTSTTNAYMLNVRDFGAMGDGDNDDTAAFTTALSNLNSAGGGSLYIPAGTYVVTEALTVQGNTSVFGDGMGATVITLPNNLNNDVKGLLRTAGGDDVAQITNVRIRDLTLDGNRDNQSSGEQFGFYCGTPATMRDADTDITCWRVECRNFNGYGFDPHEATVRVYLIECTSHDNAYDGFTLDGVTEGVVRACYAFNNDRHGFNIITNSKHILVEQCFSHNNQGNGFTVQNGSSVVTISRCLSYSNRTDGIYCMGVDDIMISNNHVALNMENGIRIRGCGRNTITGNRLRDNSQGEHDRFSEIILDNDEDIPTVDCAVLGNHVTCTGDVRARYGIRETEGDGNVLQARNAFVANKVSGGVTSDYGVSGEESVRNLNA